MFNEVNSNEFRIITKDALRQVSSDIYPIQIRILVSKPIIIIFSYLLWINDCEIIANFSSKNKTPKYMLLN